jgi:hypothetical protein
MCVCFYYAALWFSVTHELETGVPHIYMYVRASLRVYASSRLDFLIDQNTRDKLSLLVPINIHVFSLIYIYLH